MTHPKYQIESAHPMFGPLLPAGGLRQLRVHDRALAIAVAAKSMTTPYGQEIRVTHLPSGEVIFRKTASSLVECLED